MKKFFPLLLINLLLLVQAFAQLTLKVTGVPDNTPSDADIYVAGSFQNWNPKNPNYLLTNNGNNTWQITINPPAGQLKYKFTRGSWATVEGNANGGFLPDRTLNYNGSPTTVEVQILSWEDLGPGGGCTAAGNVHILDEDFFMPQLNRNRRIWIYLPPDYDSNPNKRYPVLYLHDGQNVFDACTSFSGEWEVDESLNALFTQGDHGCIAVAIDNGGAARLDEYSPWVNASYNEGGEGDEYLDFLINTLKPYIDANYRTLGSRDFTAVMGSSLGGLISHYGLIKHQDVVSKAGVLSPAFWFNQEVFGYSASTPKQNPMKIYFLAGQLEGSGSVVDDVNAMYNVLLGNGFSEPQELKKVLPADGQHSEWFWAREFPAAYLWLFAGLNFTGATEQESKQIRMYPVPTDSLLHFDNVADLRRPTYQIFSLDGKLMAKGRLRETYLDLSYLPAGVYVLQIFNRREVVFNAKFLKK
jgi:metallo-beta-lactamase class B